MDYDTFHPVVRSESHTRIQLIMLILFILKVARHKCIPKLFPVNIRTLHSVFCIYQSSNFKSQLSFLNIKGQPFHLSMKPYNTITWRISLTFKNIIKKRKGEKSYQDKTKLQFYLFFPKKGRISACQSQDEQDSRKFTNKQSPEICSREEMTFHLPHEACMTKIQTALTYSKWIAVVLNPKTQKQDTLTFQQMRGSQQAVRSSRKNN